MKPNCWALAAVLIVKLSWAWSPAVTVAQPTKLESHIDEVIARLQQQQGVPGISVAVAKENQLFYSKGFGLAEVEHSVPATVTTRYRTASVAKTLTAVVVLSLAEEKRLDLDADIRNCLTEFPEKRWPVTCRQLLGHLGGIRHYKNSAEASSTAHFFSLRSALSTFADDPLTDKPGAKFQYSSFGYNLLGSIAEAAGDADFMELLQAKVLDPAGMKDTVADDHFAVIHGRAAGYMRPAKLQLNKFPKDHNFREGQLYNSTLHDTSMKIPGGGLLSTPADLVRFAIAVNQGKLLCENTLQQMWTAQQTIDGQKTNYGLGWRVGRQLGEDAVWHTGGQSGTSTILYLIPKTGTCVAIMCNLQDVSLLNTAVAIANLVELPPSMNYNDALLKLQAAIRYEVEQKDLPAFSISLVDRDRVVWAEGFGYQDARKKIPATAETVYRVGSVSKLFTDIAVLQLVEEGKLDLDAAVQQYLQGFQPKNPYGIPLTLRQLMSHQSGLVRESPVGNYFDPDEPTLQATVASLNDTTLVYQPESKTKYSNAAIAVVGSVLETQLEISHPEQIRRRILDPLKMKFSSFVVNPDITPKLATGWMWTYDGRRFEAPTFLLGTGPAGNLYSNVLDLSKFLSCLFHDGKFDNGAILQSESLEQMMTPIQDKDGKPQGFGLGFHVQELDGYTKIGHGGAIYGFSTQLEALPERKLGVAAVSALDGTNGVVQRLADYALRLMIATQDGKPLPDYRRTGPIPPERAQDLIGKYREIDGKQFTSITELNGDVYMQQGPYRYELRAAVDDGSILVDSKFGFGTKVTLKDNGIAVGGKNFERLPDTPPVDIPDRWRGLIGEYGWDHNTLYILEEDGQLYALIEWFYYYPLKELNENTFEFPDAGLYHGEKLHFLRNANGVATAVIAAEVRFERRNVGTIAGETFKITPVKPIDELRAAALAATPPPESGQYLDPALIELTSLDATIKKDIRYATTNNFTGAVFYKQAKAFMQKPAAEAVVRANQSLKPRGLGLLIHDAYRPWFVTKMFWDATPDNLKDFVANPANGSRHNRGCAVDLTLYDLTTGQPIQMVAGYDEFSPRSFPLYPGGTSRQRWYRELLRRTMEAQSFTIYEYEWWHFDYKDWKQYRIGNLTFEKLGN